ncbi:hypothetical protein BXZ70DRAFT_892067 [Cristinia sonorae]|uniref:Uncharacterized protein n=1 Tax=Cristinia sonorae TaxID=1940300 RepID=A0A8K0URP8_9AGAR|nr:hypothetical protein BXZ70DRAFT_892067 [Cristinia sonorae]
MHLPRSVFSQRQLDLFLWLLKINDVDAVPSVRSMQALNARLQRMCGIDTIAYQGALGHTYHVNDLAQIIAQEMANPKVRPHLRFYPEDTGDVKLTEGRQGARWLKEMPDELLTPMARLGTQDYFIHEPALLRSGLVCMPVRWFTREENGRQEIYAKCWEMHPINTELSSGWRVVKKDETLEHPELMSQASESDDGEDQDEDSDNANGPPRKRKKTRKKTGGRVPDGKDFWSRVDTFFEEQIKLRGTSMTGSKWKQ